jgi:transcription initiation factor TFIID subunit 6
MGPFPLRDVAASLISTLAKKYSRSTTALKPRLARTFLKNLLDPSKPLGTHYGCIKGLHAIGGPEVVRVLILPNLKEYESVIKDEIVDDGPRKAEAEKVLSAIVEVLSSLTEDQVPLMNGHSAEAGEEIKRRLIEVVGELAGSKIVESGQMQLAKAILESQA